MNPFSYNTIVRRRADILEAALDNEIVLANADNGRISDLNETGAEIWRRLASPIRVSELCDQLEACFAVERATLESDVMTFLNRLHQFEMIDIDDCDIRP